MGRYSTLTLLFGLILIPTLLFGQFNNNTTSPYSRYGLGDLQDYSFGRTSAMGGASIASRYNRQINLANPASFNAIDSLGFMFETGLNARGSKFSNDIGEFTANDVNFQYFAMNFRVSRYVGAALGLKPFSDIGYNVTVLDNDEIAGYIYTQYYGGGTISKAFLGLGIKPIENLSLGANINYSFGLLNQNSEVGFLNDVGNIRSDYYIIQQFKSTRVSDFSFEFGAQATIPIKEGHKIIMGAVLENNPKYRAFSSDLSIKKISSTIYSDSDTLNATDEEKGIIEFPLSLGLGLSYVKEDVLEINVDYYHQAWGDSKFFGEESSYLTDLNKFAIGAEWVPDKFSIRGYFNRVSYRAGVAYKQTYLKFDDQQINDYGITFGIGLPIYRSNSTINVAAEFGRRGTKKYNLVLEKYAKLNVSVNLYDLWFIKRRFD
ncbi:MAG: hypothetical protein JXR61_05110 [Prolixibacteraceae bacterium]|nr:hypothetical protein [Prolixibacteraceae bacterium]